ncbi:enoyl-CoA hydratase/isomerase family protein [Aquabacterium sp.]|uniref:enoyl-CoA hydratase/isomerase family protein n=1 Tax=Aquabacterium sp. TaxID=1872578 RepID=UPI00248A5052|nr:enoyl-CoA hydratase/isomerase family protein [Aquabacterium sp.]MDI1259511.1 enoyl-CoA hydratase/isomerase family protein [Aquabacterium sp.]
MANLKLTRVDKVQVLTWNDGGQGNVFNGDAVGEWSAALDELENTQGNTGLVITSDDPKFFSSGLDVPWVMQQADVKPFIGQLEDFFIRLSLLNMPVVAAINGHAYAGGAVLACAADFRYMRADRGRFCFSEVKLGLAFTDPLLEVIRLLPAPGALYELALTGDAWGGDECAARGVVSAALQENDVLSAAMTRAEQLAGFDRRTYTAIKRGLRRFLVRPV